MGTAERVEQLMIVIEALQQFVDNMPDIDEPDPVDLRKAEVAQRMLDAAELTLVEIMQGE